MKTKIIAVVFVSALLSSVAFASTVNKKAKKENSSDLNVRTVLLEKQVQSLQNKINSMERKEKRVVGTPELDTLVEMYAHGPAVVTSPALGVRRSADDASDLAVKLSSINEDLVLLQLRKKMDDYAIENGLKIPERPIIALSGGIEGEIKHAHKYDKTEKTDINLSRVELDVIGEAGPWATTGMIINYEDKASGDRRVKNSRVKIDRAFLTMGQLNKFPLYLTIGQIFAPFGGYSSEMVTDPSTQLLGRMKDRMAVLGGYWRGLQAQIYGYSGEIRGSHSLVDRMGFNLGYDYAKDKFKFGIAGGMIGNLAESDGMQDSIFAKNYVDNSKPVRNEQLKHRVAGINGQFKIGYHPFTLRAEYVGAIKKFDQADISFKDDGAKPQALQIEGVVEFDLLGRPNNFAVGYGHTWEALALELPRDTFFGVYRIAAVKNAILSLEYKHDINYGWDATAKGRGSDSVIVKDKGRHSNTVTANLGIYF